MRIIGQYKGDDIRITDMHMSETYGGFLALSKNRYEEVNRRLVNVDVLGEITKIWGQNRPFCVANLAKIDYTQLLPPVRVIVWVSCGKLIKDSTADGSHLFMAWFQESDEDPFAKAVSNLKEIAWEEKAQDFWF